MKVFDTLLKTIDPFSPTLSLTFHIFHLKFSQMFAAFILLFATTVILPITVNAYFCFSMFISLLFTLTIYNVTLVPFSRPVAIWCDSKILIHSEHNRTPRCSYKVSAAGLSWLEQFSVTLKFSFIHMCFQPAQLWIHECRYNLVIHAPHDWDECRQSQSVG